MTQQFKPRRPSLPDLGPPNSQYTGQFEPVDPGFLLKSLAAAVAAALLFAYTTLVVVYTRKQWQLVLHPDRVLHQMPDQTGLNYVEVRFDDSASGQPQLDGWWLPSDDPTDPTVLLLHAGDGNMSDELPIAHTLHDANLNVLLFDYRGFGHSAGQHPTQEWMTADAEAAYGYLTGTRGIAASSVLVLGEGSGAALAVMLCQSHVQVPALILLNPDGDFGPRAADDVRSHLLPAGLLFHQDFPLAAPLRSLSTPKLLISTDVSSVPALLKNAADPKTTVELPKSDTAALEASLARFISTYVPAAKEHPEHL